MYIVTGGAGLIGSAFVARLNEEGINNILVVDELKDSEKWKNLSNKSFEDYMHKTEFLDSVLKDNIPQADEEDSIKAIIHMGACSTTTETNMDYLYKNNFQYTRTLARYAMKKRIRFIYASSAATYGNGSNGYDDDHACISNLQPLNRYGFSKQLFDLWALKSEAVNRIAGIKFFNVYGPNEYHKGKMVSMAYRAFKQIKETGTVKLFKSYHPDYADGEQMRDFVYVKDCCDAMWWLINNPKVNGLFNFGTGKAQSWNELAEAAFDALNLQTRIEYVDMPDNLKTQYQYFTEANMSKLKEAGCPVEFRPLSDGVQDYICSHLDTDSPYY